MFVSLGECCQGDEFFVSSEIEFVGLTMGCDYKESECGKIYVFWGK